MKGWGVILIGNCPYKCKNKIILSVAEVGSVAVEPVSVFFSLCLIVTRSPFMLFTVEMPTCEITHKHISVILWNFWSTAAISLSVDENCQHVDYDVTSLMSCFKVEFILCAVFTSLGAPDLTQWVHVLHFLTLYKTGQKNIHVDE